MFGWLPELNLPDWMGTDVKITVFAVAAFFVTLGSLKRRQVRLTEETSDTQATPEAEAGPHAEAAADCGVFRKDGTPDQRRCSRWAR